MPVPYRLRTGVFPYGQKCLFRLLSTSCQEKPSATLVDVYSRRGIRLSEQRYEDSALFLHPCGMNQRRLVVLTYDVLHALPVLMSWAMTSCTGTVTGEPPGHKQNGS